MNDDFCAYIFCAVSAKVEEIHSLRCLLTTRKVWNIRSFDDFVDTGKEGRPEHGRHDVKGVGSIG